MTNTTRKTRNNNNAIRIADDMTYTDGRYRTTVSVYAIVDSKRTKVEFSDGTIKVVANSKLRPF